MGLDVIVSKDEMADGDDGMHVFVWTGELRDSLSHLLFHVTYVHP